MSVPDNTLLSEERVRSMRAAIDTKLMRRRHGRRLTAAVGAGALAIAATAGGVAVQQASIKDLNTRFECHVSTDPGVPYGETAFGDGHPANAADVSLAERVAFAVSVCTASYNAVPTGGDKPDLPPVPNPTGCVLPDGRIAVYPNADALTPKAFCSLLALTSP